MEVTAHIPPRPHVDWTEALALSAIGRPVTLPGKLGMVERQVIGKILACKVEHGFLAITMEVPDGSPTGTAKIGIMQNLRERRETVISVAIVPDKPR